MQQKVSAGHVPPRAFYPAHNVCLCSSMDRTTGFYPVNGGSNPSGGTRYVRGYPANVGSSPGGGITA